MLLPSEIKILTAEYWEYTQGLENTAEWILRLKKDKRRFANNNSKTKEVWEEELWDAENELFFYKKHLKSAVDIFNKHCVPIPKDEDKPQVINGVQWGKGFNKWLRK